jgi:hypothetical protein
MAFEPEGDAFAVSTATEFTQVIDPVTMQETEGVEISASTMVLADEVQPFDCVTVTVYAPAVNTVVEAVVAPLLHK